MFFYKYFCCCCYKNNNDNIVNDIDIDNLKLECDSMKPLTTGFTYIDNPIHRNYIKK